MTEFKHIVTSEDDGLEIRQITRKYFDFSARLRNKVKREKLTMRNGVPAEGWHKAVCGDVISVTLPEEKSCFSPQPIPLDVIFEDDDIMVINKQPGLIVHPTKGHPDGTVANALMHYMEQHKNKWKIRFVNRLDMDTSGLLLVAKNAYCQNNITNQMRQNLISKKYVSLVSGTMDEESGTIDLPIGRPDPNDVRRGVMADGAPSVTHYKVIEHLSGYTFVELILETGRTHQIRVHMSHIGHPIVGDHLYGSQFPDIINRQALHAESLSLIHPIKGSMLEFHAPIPEDINHALEQLR